MSKCKHCGDEVLGGWNCPSCGGRHGIHNQCRECHSELAHGAIQNQNIHICGSPYTGHQGVDGDPDAWEPSWKAGN